MKSPRTNNMVVAHVITAGHSRTTDYVEYACGCTAVVPADAPRYHHARSRCANPTSPAWAATLADRVDGVIARTARPRRRVSPAAAMVARFAAVVNRPRVPAPVTTANFFRRNAIITDADVAAFESAIA